MTVLTLTGRPGAGKTTLIKKLVETLKNNNVSLSGFYTEEIRQGGKRCGFDVVLLNGTRGPLARLGAVGAQNAGPCVGQYKVDITSFESLVLPLLEEQISRPVKCFIIDEIGKMELFSKKFEAAVQKLLLQQSTVLIATIPLPKGQPIRLVEHIRSSAKVYMIKLCIKSILFLSHIMLIFTRRYKVMVTCFASRQPEPKFIGATTIEPNKFFITTISTL